MLAETLTHLFPGITLGPVGEGADCAIVDDGKGPRIVEWRRLEKQPTDAELLAAEPAALATQQAEEVKRIESTTARDDAKRALEHLDTIIAGIDGATLAQAKAAIKQEAQILRHIILATVGR